MEYKPDISKVVWIRYSIFILIQAKYREGYLEDLKSQDQVQFIDNEDK